MDDTINISGVIYIKKQDIPTKDGKEYCIIRGRNSGVHAGFMKKHDLQYPTVVELETSRRLWKWFGRTLSGLALEGTPDTNKCKFGPQIPQITILDACEIIPCTTEAIISLNEVKDWENE